MLDSVAVAQPIVFQRELKALTESLPLQVSSFVDLPTELTADGRTFQQFSDARVCYGNRA